MSQHLSEQEIIRREKLGKLKEAGIDAYPAPLYPVSHFSADIKKEFSEETKDNFASVCVAGRIMSINDKGKVFFIKIQDSKGIIQLYVKRDDICPGEDKSFWDNVVKHGLDLGDIIGSTGFVFITKTGETSIHAQTITLLTKSLKPLPVVKRDEHGHVFDAVTDPEFRYRQRYADLIINPDVKETFVKRTKLINTIRDFLNGQGAIEVDTPVLQSIPGGAAARPFMTHHNTLDMPFYLRIANELYLKRLIVGGFDWVYEFSRNFRNEGMDRTHNPEFTVLEWYTAYKDYFWMMEVTEQLIEKIALALHGTTEVKVGETIINFKAPFKRLSIYDAIKENTGIDISEMNEDELRTTCKQLHIEVDASMGKGKLVDALFGEKAEYKYVQPTFIIDYPVEMSPLTKKHRSKPGLVERFELMINGKEIANAYSELNDPIDQRERFEEQVRLMERGDDEAMFIDYDFLRALEYGMPPTSGIGIGIDRLCMLMTNQPSIQDVLLFPQMRPERMEEQED
ncbi:lysine--tRNA ligase [Danxiaibacter flavus]|uniref:Lysine--tRNA ligase n=1 Tax=Danxiaibacter flavus TaxID=3049108 RepID=A0ABV3ZK64_9BACT|nr:lysine--tRNA ligase [Chitinophagaceae bacterium DXS]